jgi:hypothetical protein
MKVAFVKYRTKKYGKWIPKDRKVWKRVEVEGKLTLTDEIKEKLSQEEIVAVDLIVNRVENK